MDRLENSFTPAGANAGHTQQKSSPHVNTVKLSTHSQCNWQHRRLGSIAQVAVLFARERKAFTHQQQTKAVLMTVRWLFI
jgi:hypothetical protein